MMSRIVRFFSIFSLLTFIGAANALAQPNLGARLDWGPDYRDPSNTMVTNLVGITPAGFYVLRQKVLQNPSAKQRAWLEYYSRDMKMQKTEELELKYKGKQRDFEQVLFLDKKLYLLTSFNNAVKKRNYMFKQEINSRTLAPSKDLDMIAETESRNKEVKGNFGFNLSKDSTTLLIYTELPYVRKQPERFGFHVFDRDFNPIWTKDIELPYPDNQFTVEEYRVDNKGNVFLLGVLYQDEAKWRRRGSPTYRYIILAYTENGTKSRQYQIDLDGKFITDMTFRIADDGQLVCSGFYSERGTYSIKGIYYFRLDPVTHQFNNRNHKPFDFEFLTEHLSDKNKERARSAELANDRRRAPELFDYSLDELVLRSDGGAVLVAEQFFIYQETTRDYPYYGGYPYYGYYPYSYYRPYYQTNYYYNYNDIIVVNIKPTGEIEWSSRIPKLQETRNEGGYFSSYAMAIGADRFYFVFNDNARNYDPTRKTNRMYNYNGTESVIVLAEVSKEGKVSAVPLATNRDAGVITRPKICKQIGRREMVIFGERSSTFRFASLKFD